MLNDGTVVRPITRTSVETSSILIKPIMFYVLLEQYEEDEFGVDDNCGLDPTSECDGFPRWAIPIIIGAAFSLGKRIIEYDSYYISHII